MQLVLACSDASAPTVWIQRASMSKHQFQGFQLQLPSAALLRQRRVQPALWTSSPPFPTHQIILASWLTLGLEGNQRELGWPLPGHQVTTHAEATTFYQGQASRTQVRVPSGLCGPPDLSQVQPLLPTFQHSASVQHPLGVVPLPAATVSAPERVPMVHLRAGIPRRLPCEPQEP